MKHLILRKVKSRQLLIETTLFIFIFILHFNMSLNLSDDANFSRALESSTFLSYMKYCYMEVNGKVILDLLCAIFTSINPLIWKIINSTIILIIINTIEKLAFIFGGGRYFGKPYSILLTGLIILNFPIRYLNSAGWCATSINYIWPLCFLLIALVPLQDILTHTNGREHNNLLYIGAAFMAGSQEQSGAILATVYLIAIIYCIWKNKSVSKRFLVLFIVVSFSLLFMLSSPGQKTRVSDYSIFRIPEWQMLSFIEKLQLGITSTSAQIFFENSFIYIYFAILLGFGTYNSTDDKIVRICGFTPMTILIVIALFPPLKNFFHYSPPWGYGLPDFRPINVMTVLEWRYYIPTILSFLIIGGIFISFIYIFDTWRTRITTILTFSAGLVSRIIMGFSPTLYGSSYRTFIYMYFSLIICNCLLLYKITQNKRNTKNMFIAILIIFFMMQSIQSLHYLY